jgi:hypothetical protein
MASILAQSAHHALRAISTVLPNHTKRLVLWSTLYGRMCGQQSFTKEQCDRLNGAMVLVKDNAALALPAKLGKFIWSDLEACTAAVRKAIRGEKGPEEAAAEFLRSIPTFLRYASDALMLKDFQTLLSTHRRAT